MNDSYPTHQSKPEALSLRPNSVGTWSVIAVLVALLFAVAVLGYLGWTSSDTDVPASGYVAMAAGVVFSLVVGVGLMALVFYSSRKGYDEPAVLIREPGQDRDNSQTTSRQNGA